ncbi:MAG: hypothetical protein WCP96_20885 [Methylococcaceae bacterium]
MKISNPTVFSPEDYGVSEKKVEQLNREIFSIFQENIIKHYKPNSGSEFRDVSDGCAPKTEKRA